MTRRQIEGFIVALENSVRTQEKLIEAIDCFIDAQPQESGILMTKLQMHTLYAHLVRSITENYQQQSKFLTMTPEEDIE